MIAKSKSYLVQNVIQALNDLAPLDTAESWDNVGLILGDPSQAVSRALVAIDLTPEAIQVAIQKKCNLIVNHHPCIFPKQKGWSRILAGSPVFEALQNKIAVAAYHTNFDLCSMEVIHAVSKGLGVQPKGRLYDSAGVKSQLIKLVVFIPRTHIEEVRAAITSAGAGQVGQYDHCTFGTPGEGTFKGGAQTQPFLGEPGKLEKAQEIRLETILPRGMQKKVLDALLKAHPYEEVAYDFYPVEQPASQLGLVPGLGYGFWGEFTAPKPFSDLAKDVKSLFNIHGFWVTEPVPAQVKRVSFAAGKGAAFVESAARLNCDLMITGEAGYHTAVSGARQGTAVMEIGHRESEKFFIETMKAWLSRLELEVEVVQTPTQAIWQGGKR